MKKPATQMETFMKIERWFQTQAGCCSRKYMPEERKITVFNIELMKQNIMGCDTLVKLGDLIISYGLKCY